ncbi:MAG: UbiA family prenyltransferase, partial [Abditibacteriota bacterium]|nr:UbiA family prenyltransferase [Abditibacteriota bacterium]
MKDFIRLIRPHHWVKNILIFFPIIFNSQLFIPELFTKAIWGFIAFCLAASAVYTVNDICDAEHDKKHSVKKDRPVASGRVSKNSAAVLASVLVIGALAVNAFISRSPLDWICLVSYLILNFAYSRGLKNVPI